MTNSKINGGELKLTDHRYKGINKKTFEDFNSILDRLDESLSYRENLEGLSIKELEIIQKAQGLTHKICVDELSDEALINLLASRKDQLLDLNGDGIVAIGNSNMFLFPPVTAPDKVKRAWADLASGMNAREAMLAQGMFLARQFEANCQVDSFGSYHVLKPGEIGYKSAFGTSVESYTDLCTQMIQGYEGQKNYMSQGKSTLQWRVEILSQFRNRLRDDDYLTV